MQFYLVKRNNEIDWDEDRAAVIAAKSIVEARLIAQTLSGDWSNFEITKLSAFSFKESKVILRDNNQG